MTPESASRFCWGVSKEISTNKLKISWTGQKQCERIRLTRSCHCGLNRLKRSQRSLSKFLTDVIIRCRCCKLSQAINLQHAAAILTTTWQSVLNVLSCKLQAALSGALRRSPARNLPQQQQQTAARRGKTTLECCTVGQPRMIDTHVPPTPLHLPPCPAQLKMRFSCCLKVASFVAAVHGQARVAIVSQK